MLVYSNFPYIFYLCMHPTRSNANFKYANNVLKSLIYHLESCFDFNILNPFLNTHTHIYIYSSVSRPYLCKYTNIYMYLHMLNKQFMLLQCIQRNVFQWKRVELIILLNLLLVDNFGQVGLHTKLYFVRRTEDNYFSSSFNYKYN